MTKVATKSVGKLEWLSTTLNGYQAANRAVHLSPTADNVLTLIRATNVLLDACVDCGMPMGTADLEGWAAETVVDFLRRAA